MEVTVLSDRYVILLDLGEGPYAATYLARTAENGGHCVIRIPSARLMEHPTFADRLERTTRKMLGVRHPHVVRVTDAGRHDDVPYYVAAYVEGESLQHRLSGPPGTQTHREVLTWLLDVAEALDFVHANRAVHGEVRPSQILFDRNGRVHVTDFTVAAAMVGLGHKAQRRLFVPHDGTTAPELRKTARMTPASDQFALAATVHAALTGETVGDEGEAVIERLQQAVPAEASMALLRALHPDPAKRFESCRAFAHAFAHAPASRAGTPVLRGGGIRGLETIAPPPLDALQPAPPGARLDAVLPQAAEAETVSAARGGQLGLRCWGIRLGPNDLYAGIARDAGFVAVNWGEVGEHAALSASATAPTLRSLADAFREAYPSTDLRARVGAALLWRFVNEMQPGDLVLLPQPDKRLVHVGRIDGAYYYVEQPDDGCEFRRRRKVEWLRSVPLDRVPGEILRDLGSARPLVGLSSHRAPILALLEGVDASGRTQPADTLAHLLERLRILPVRELHAVLATLFECYHVDGTPLPGDDDETWEMVGRVTAHGLADVLLRIQVRTADRDVGAAVVHEVRRALDTDEHGAVVTLSGFAEDARVEAMTGGRKTIRLIDGPELAQRVLDGWGSLAPELQKALGLRRIEETRHFVRFERL